MLLSKLPRPATRSCVQAPAKKPAAKAAAAKKATPAKVGRVCRGRSAGAGASMFLGRPWHEAYRCPPRQLLNASAALPPLSQKATKPKATAAKVLPFSVGGKR